MLKFVDIFCRELDRLVHLKHINEYVWPVAYPNNDAVHCNRMRREKNCNAIEGKENFYVRALVQKSFYHFCFLQWI